MILLFKFYHNLLSNLECLLDIVYRKGSLLPSICSDFKTKSTEQKCNSKDFSSFFTKFVWLYGITFRCRGWKCWPWRRLGFDRRGRQVLRWFWKKIGGHESWGRLRGGRFFECIWSCPRYRSSSNAWLYQILVIWWALLQTHSNSISSIWFVSSFGI